jgi:hypothetical protein
MASYVEHKMIPGVVWMVKVRRFDGTVKVAYFGCADEESQARNFRKRGLSLNTKETIFHEVSLDPAPDLLVIALAANGAKERHK